MMNVSIIIPIYNHADSLRCVLESILHLNYSLDQIEVIVIDDCSSENIAKVVDEYKDEYRIKYHKMQMNTGRSAARNYGIEISEGEILIFNDGDRILHPEMIYEHIQSLSINEKSVCIGNNLDLFLFRLEEMKDAKQLVTNLLKDNGRYKKCMRYYYYQELVGMIYDEEGETTSEVAWISLMSGNMSIKREYIDTIGGFDENFKLWGIENMEFGHRLLSNGFRFHYNKNAINYHIYHKQNRNVADLAKYIEYFYQKTKDEKIKQYYEFLQGKITLSTLTDQSIDNNSYYISNHLGSKYRL